MNKNKFLISLFVFISFFSICFQRSLDCESIFDCSRCHDYGDIGGSKPFHCIWDNDKDICEFSEEGTNSVMCGSKTALIVCLAIFGTLIVIGMTVAIICCLRRRKQQYEIAAARQQAMEVQIQNAQNAGYYQQGGMVYAQPVQYAQQVPIQGQYIQQPMGVEQGGYNQGYPQAYSQGGSQPYIFNNNPQNAGQGYAAGNYQPQQNPAGNYQQNNNAPQAASSNGDNLVENS